MSFLNVRKKLDWEHLSYFHVSRICNLSSLFTLKSLYLLNSIIFVLLIFICITPHTHTHTLNLKKTSNVFNRIMDAVFF